MRTKRMLRAIAARCHHSFLPEARWHLSDVCDLCGRGPQDPLHTEEQSNG